MRNAGYVLVGGNSSRMGRDKALLSYRGTTLAGHVAAQVQAAAGSATLIGSPRLYSAIGYPVVMDLFDSLGPVGGLATALSISPADWNLVVACDMPLLTGQFLTALLEKAVASATACLVPVSPDGCPQPLCAVYHRCCLPPLIGAIHANLLKMESAIEKLEAVRWPVAESRWFANLNTAEEWARHQASLQDQRAE